MKEYIYQKLKFKYDFKKLKFGQSAEDVAKKSISQSFVVSLALVITAIIYSAMYLQGESLAVVAGIIAPIGIGLLQLMTSVTGAKEEDPMASIMKELVQQNSKPDPMLPLVQELLKERSKKEDDPMAEVLKDLVKDKLSNKEAFDVDVVDGKVSVSHGDKNINIKE